MIQLIVNHKRDICNITTKTFITLQLGLLAQTVERGADNAKVVSSILTQTIIKFFFADLLTVSLFYL